MVLPLYAKGTSRDIAEHLEITYGFEISDETIANIADAINETVKEWRNRPLEEVYPILSIEAIRIQIRDGDQVRIKASHLAVGVDMDGRKRPWGCGSSRPGARSSGPGCSLSSATAVSATC